MSSHPEQPGTDPSRITQLLNAAGAGISGASEELLPLVFDELRRMAAQRLARTPPGQTLQATALVHEAYLRLLGEAQPGWENRGHFFFAAARAVHHILVERARQKASLKRGGDRRRVSIENLRVADEAPPDDLLALDDALEKLAARDPQAHRIVMLRFFAGLSEAETAEVLGVSDRTLRREWRYIRAELQRLLSSESDVDPLRGPAE